MNQNRIKHMIEREKYFLELLDGKDLSDHGHWEKGYRQGRLSVLESLEDLGAMEEDRMGRIRELVKEAHSTAVEHGWWKIEPEFGTLIALCHSELSEALEEYRDGHSPEEIRETLTAAPRKPEGISVELADTVIRIFDMCGHYGIDLEEAILKKMEYNKGRPYKHGWKVI